MLRMFHASGRKFQFGQPTRALWLGTFSCLWIFSGCSQDAGSSSTAAPGVHVSVELHQASHQKMREILKAVDRDAQESHPFLGMRQLRVAKENLAKFGATASVAELSVLHGIYGQELLRTGKTAEALDQMKQALTLLESNTAAVDPIVLQQVMYQVAIAHLRDGEKS